MKENELENLSAEDSYLIKHIILLIDSRNFSDAITEIQQCFASGLDLSKRMDAILEVKLAGFLIDIGEESNLESAVIEGLRIHEQDYHLLKRFVKEVSLQYNIGNGKSTLFKIRRGRTGFDFSPSAIELLTEAKNHYWKSFKLFQPDDELLHPQLLVNLANSLSTSGRVVEALQYYDLVLNLYPDFPQAHYNRSQALLWLNQLSNTYTINLLWQVMVGFDKAANSSEIPAWQRDHFASQRDVLKEKIAVLGHKDTDIEHDIKITIIEYETLSLYRKFCLLNHLTLSEHSLYCKCIGARWDDLTIPMSTIPIGGPFVPRMEHVLNRLKAEYALARLLFYRSQENNDIEWNVFDEEVAFTELYEHEAIGLRPEMLRTSFRLCFGILDKIAHALCELFELAQPEDNIYFESFWKSNEKRWNKINSIKNFSLIALYSQATDLNSKSGEWSLYKNWRNSLEHEMFILEGAPETVFDPFSVYKGKFPVQRVSSEEFRLKTLHLLQLVRSAIFNFVFCVREEGSKNLSEKGSPNTLMPKV